jgi:hypothetical protein
MPTGTTINTGNYFEVSTVPPSTSTNPFIIHQLCWHSCQAHKLYNVHVLVEFTGHTNYEFKRFIEHNLSAFLADSFLVCIFTILWIQL